IKDSLTVKLNEAMENLKCNNYEDTDSQTYRMLSEFIELTKNEDKLKSQESSNLIKSIEALIARLD
ncbi:MAG TPA: hypothetical protein VF884_07880, partial [Nitrososphaeraceae archaeon]